MLIIFKAKSHVVGQVSVGSLWLVEPVVWGLKRSSPLSSHPTPGSKGKRGVGFRGGRGGQVSGWGLRWDTWHTPERSDRGCCSTGVVMLHSGQSSPGTPVRPGSITGTGPADEKDYQYLQLHAHRICFWSKISGQQFGMWFHMIWCKHLTAVWRNDEHVQQSSSAAANYPVWQVFFSSSCPDGYFIKLEVSRIGSPLIVVRFSLVDGGLQSLESGIF